MITRVKFIAIAAVLVASLSGATVAEARQGMGGGMGGGMRHGMGGFGGGGFRPMPMAHSMPMHQPMRMMSARPAMIAHAQPIHFHQGGNQGGMKVIHSPPVKHVAWADGGRNHHEFGDHRRHHRHFVVIGAPYYAYNYADYADYDDYAYADNDDCSWLHRKAIHTGRAKWWRLYEQCVSG